MPNQLKDRYIKPRLNARNISTQHIATSFLATPNVDDELCMNT